MSGIVGIYHTDGRPVDALSVGRMADTLAHRGLDGRGVWCDGSIGLGHRMFWETPESLFERQPLEDKEAGLVLTADARIDNRDDLIHQLGLTGENPAQITDARLILASYAKWGEDCVDHLIGDFAFVIWDARRRSLFCARDYVGIKPFYYGFENGRFTFASELKAILCQDESPRDLNEEMIAKYLAVDHTDLKITFYEGLLRLAPAHTMCVDRHGLRQRCYWKADPKRVLKLKSNAEYAEAFRERFAEAVRCRLRSHYPVGSALSGGMDSSSIVCMSRDLLAQEGHGRVLKTFSATFPHLPNVDEQHYQDAVIAAGGIEAHKISMEELGPLQTYTDGQRGMDYPYLGGTYYLHYGMYRKAREQGVRVFLDGHGGDDVVSHGLGYLVDLLRGFRFARCFRESRALAKRHGVSLARVLKANVLRPVIPHPALLAWRLLRHSRVASPPSRNSLFAPAFLARAKRLKVDLGDDQRTERVPNMRAEHASLFTSGLYVFTFELADQLSYGHSLVTRFPFFDQRFAEFCLSLPHAQKLSDGFTRVVLRRALSGVLPVEIQRRAGKSDLSPHFYRMVLGKENPLYLELLGDLPERLAEYVDTSVLRERLQSCFSAGVCNGQFASTLWLPITLAVWLRGDRTFCPKKGGAWSSQADLSSEC